MSYLRWYVCHIHCASWVPWLLLNGSWLFKSHLLREKFWNLVGRVRSLPPSCFQASSLVLILKKNDRRNIGSGILMIFNLIVELMCYSQGHLIRGLFLVGGVLLPYVLNDLNLLILAWDTVFLNEGKKIVVFCIDFHIRFLGMKMNIYIDGLYSFQTWNSNWLPR